MKLEEGTFIHLLLTDLVMPDGMSGKDFDQRILQENPKLKVIYPRSRRGRRARL